MEEFHRIAVLMEDKDQIALYLPGLHPDRQHLQVVQMVEYLLIAALMVEVARIV